jgi:hypothetical protein
MEEQIRAHGLPEILVAAGSATGVSAGPATGRSAGPASGSPAGSNPEPSAGFPRRGDDSLEWNPGCRRCQARDKALHFAFIKLHQAEGRVEAYETLYREAAERSTAKIGAYDALYRLHDRMGMPFVDGAGIHPKELMRFPRHEQDDVIRKAILNKIVGEAAGLDNGPELDLEALEAAGREATKEGSERRPGSSASSTRSQESTGTKESEESIPPEFLPGESEDSDNSDDDSLNEESSEPDNEWELDPDIHSNSDGVGIHSEGGEGSDAEDSDTDSAEGSDADSAQDLDADSADGSGADSAGGSGADSAEGSGVDSAAT